MIPDRNKIVIIYTTVVSILLACALTAGAFVLPDCAITDEEKNLPAEDVLSSYVSELKKLSSVVNTIRIEENKQDPRKKLTSKEKKSAKQYWELKDKERFWKDIVSLKKDMLALNAKSKDIDKGITQEADRISKLIIEKLYLISQEWRVGGLALFRNFLINIGLKDKGRCYQYVEELQKALSSGNWKYFEIHWGVAYKETFRENNSIVITPVGQDFKDGLVIDAWRKAGRPYWILVKEDHHYPWIELQ